MCEESLSYSGHPDTFMVPAGVSSVNIVLDGAGSGTSPGGEESGTVSGLSGGQSLTVVLGGMGTGPRVNFCGANGGTGGYGGGGAGGQGGCQAASGGAGGGGGSFVFGPDGSLLLAAGGAGGGGGSVGPPSAAGGGEGGAGGGTAGGSNGVGYYPDYRNGQSTGVGGSGATTSGAGKGGAVIDNQCTDPSYQPTPGSDGSGPASSSTTFGTGGAGGTASDTSPTNGGCNPGAGVAGSYAGGGGGGGGYYGGGGGAGGFPAGTGGGGGSGFASPNVSNAQSSTAASAANGSVTFTFAPPGPQLSIANAPAVNEPASGSVNATFTISLSETVSSAVTVDYQTADGTGENGATTANNDYTATSGAATIPAGQTSTQITVPVDAGSGKSTTATKYFMVSLSNASGAGIDPTASSADGVIDLPQIAGQVTNGANPPDGIAGVQVNLSGTADTGQSVTRTAVTDGGGNYKFHLDPGTYTVTPQPQPGRSQDEFSPGQCDGTPSQDKTGISHCKIDLPPGAAKAAYFGSGEGTVAGKISLRSSRTGRDSGIPGARVQISSSSSTVIATTGSDGSYKAKVRPGYYSVTPIDDPPRVPGTFRLPKGSYGVTECGGVSEGDICQVQVLPGGESRASFVYGGEKVKVTFDPPTVAGDGVGFARMRVEVTDVLGKPLGGHTLAIYMSGVGQVDASGGNPNFVNSQQQLAPHAIVCTPDGRRLTPTIGFTRSSEGPGFAAYFLPSRVAEQLVPPHPVGLLPAPGKITTDSSGIATAFVFAGKRYANEASPSGFVGDELTVSANDETAPGSSKLTTLHVTPANKGGAPSPRQLAGEFGGAMDLVNASSAQIQTILLEYLTALHARHAVTDDFVPAYGKYGPAGIRTDSLVAFGTYDLIPNDTAPGLGPVLDEQLATFISIPALNLPGRLPDGTEWADAHHIIFGKASIVQPGDPYLGHVSPVLADAITYFDAWPYPPTDMQLRQIFEQCVPELGRSPSIFAQLFSPVRVEFVDRKGRTFGFDKRGKRHLKIPGAAVIKGHPEQFIVPRGNYTVHLAASGNGMATLVFYYPSRGAVARTEVFTLKVHRGQTGVLHIRGSRPNATLRFGGHVYHATNGLAIHVRGLPTRLPRGHKRRVSLHVTDQLGRPVIDGIVTVKGRGFRVIALTDSKGRVRVTLKGVRGALKVTVGSLGYVPFHWRITVRKR